MSAPAAASSAPGADAGDHQPAHKSGRHDQFEYLNHYHTTTHDTRQKIDMHAPVEEPAYTELEVQQMEELRKAVGEMVNDPKQLVATPDDYPAGMHQHWTHYWPAGKDSVWFEDKFAEEEKDASRWPQHELIRFLRARDYKMKKCKEMYFHYKRWRILYGASHIGSFPQMPWEPLINSILSHSYHKWDKHGRPIYLQRSGLIDPERFAREVPLEMIGVGHTWFTEEMAKRLEIGSRMTGKRVTTLVNIIDIAKVGLGARKMLKIFATTSYIDQNFYPEELGCMYLINAPSFFPVLYSICKGFLSAKTQEKIRILGSNYKPVLVEELGAECLPEEYGGTCKCEGGCCPLATGPGYVRPGEEDAEEENLTLKAGAKKTIEIPYAPTVPRGEEEGGGEIAQEAYWSIEVPSRDVDLTVSFRPASNESNAESVDETPLTEVKPTERLASSGTAYTGVYSGATSGVIVLTVSNEYARWHTKTAKIRSGTRTASKKQVA